MAKMWRGHNEVKSIVDPAMNPLNFINDWRSNYFVDIYCDFLSNNLLNVKTSLQSCSVRKSVLKDLANFTRKHLTLVMDSLFNKKRKRLQLIKKRLQHRCFPVKFVNFLRTPILKNICERLLLKRCWNP